MPLVSVTEPHVNRTGGTIDLVLEAIDRAKGKLKILYVEITLFQLEVPPGTSTKVGREFSPNFPVAADYMPEIYSQVGARSVEIVLQMAFGQRQDAHDVLRNVGDVLRRKPGARTLECHLLRYLRDAPGI